MATGRLSTTNPVKNKRTSVKYSPLGLAGSDDRKRKDLHASWDKIYKDRSRARTVAPYQVGEGPVRLHPRAPIYKAGGPEASHKLAMSSLRKKKNRHSSETF